MRIGYSQYPATIVIDETFSLSGTATIELAKALSAASSRTDYDLYRQFIYRLGNVLTNVSGLVKGMVIIDSSSAVHLDFKSMYRTIEEELGSLGRFSPSYFVAVLNALNIFTTLFMQEGDNTELVRQVLINGTSVSSFYSPISHMHNKYLQSPP